MLQVIGKFVLDLVLDHLPRGRQHLLEGGRDITPCLLLLHDLQMNSFLVLLIDQSLGLFLDLGGILDDGDRRHEPQGVDGFGCYHAILLQLVILELFVELLIVQLRGFGQELLGLGVVAGSDDLIYLLYKWYPSLNLFDVTFFLEVLRIVD